MSQTPTVSPVEEVVEFFAQGPSRQDIAAFHLSEAAQNRLRELLRRVDRLLYIGEANRQFYLKQGIAKERLAPSAVCATA